MLREGQGRRHDEVQVRRNRVPRGASLEIESATSKKKKPSADSLSGGGKCSAFEGKTMCAKGMDVLRRQRRLRGSNKCNFASTRAKRTLAVHKPRIPWGCAPSRWRLTSRSPSRAATATLTAPPNNTRIAPPPDLPPRMCFLRKKDSPPPPRDGPRDPASACEALANKQSSSCGQIDKAARQGLRRGALVSNSYYLCATVLPRTHHYIDKCAHHHRCSPRSDHC